MCIRDRYKDKAVEVVGPKKEQAIRDAVAKEQLEKANVTERKLSLIHI